MVASLSQTIYSNNFTKMIIKQCRQLIILVNFIIKIDCALKHDHSIIISDAFPISRVLTGCTHRVICNSQFLIDGPRTQMIRAYVQFDSDFNLSFTFGDNYIS
jgi:hypothetical protein